MQTFYHGTNRLFDSFDMSHASEGSGLKFGFGVYVTQKYESAVHYALPRHDKVSEDGTYFVYTVEAPDQTEDNFLFSCRPVHQRIVADASRALGEEIPAEVCALGKTFRKYIGNKVTGKTGTVRQLSGSADFAAEKGAAEFLLRIGVTMLIWPQSQSNPDGLQNRAYPDSSMVRIVKIEQVRLDEKGQLIFSNFASTPLTVGSARFYSAESLFQVMKFSDTEVRKTIHSLKGQGLKMKAKHFEKTPGPRPDWGEILVDALKFCLMTKYEQSKGFRDELEKSKGLFIIEDQSTFTKPADTYGAKLTPDGTEYSGPNLMGRLLMELRDNGMLEYTLPEGIIDFSDL